MWHTNSISNVHISGAAESIGAEIFFNLHLHNTHETFKEMSDNKRVSLKGKEKKTTDEKVDATDCVFL